MSDGESRESRTGSQSEHATALPPPLHSRRLRNFFHNRVGSWTPQSRSSLNISTRTNGRAAPGSSQPVEPAPLSAVRREGIIYDVRPETASTVRRISHLYGDRYLLDRIQTLHELQEQLRREHRQSRVYEGSRSASIPSAYVIEPPRPPPFTGSAFTGECQLCCEEEVSLVFLLKDVSTSTSGSSQTLNFPFAGGNLPENDIISSFMCCYDCSVYVVAQSETPIREKCTAALCLYPFKENGEAWRNVLSIGLPHYPALSREHLPLVFLAIIHETLRKPWAQLDGSNENALRRNALLWTKQILLKEVHLYGDGYSDFLHDWVSNIIFRPQNGWMSYAWTYPLQGFSLWLQLASSNPDANPDDLGLVLWKRVLIEITRSCKSLLNSNPLKDLTTKTRQFITQILSPDGFDAWMGLLALEGLLQEDVMDAMEQLESQKTWVLKNCRWAAVKWLQWVPTIHGRHNPSAQLVHILVEEMGGEIVWETPCEITREWCDITEEDAGSKEGVSLLLAGLMSD